MKKIFSSLLILFLVFAVLFTSCTGKKDSDKIIVVGASPVPHAQLLELIKEDLAEQGYTLKIIEFTDYIQPNSALIAGELDANYFQHLPYLETNPDWTNKLVSAFGVHVEPFGLYSTKYESIDDLPNGAVIAIPNDPSNGGRALLLLEANGLITLRPDTGLTATLRDISENPMYFRFQELEAAQLPRSLEDLDAATINGNYAIEAGFNPIVDSLIIEGAESPYVNIIVVQKGKENDTKILALKNALLCEKVKHYINDNYDGGVAPVF